MICFLTTRKFNHTVTKCLATEGRALRGTVVARSYGSLLLAKDLPVCTYIFSDLERLAPSDLQRLQPIHDRLANDPRVTILNSPTGTLRRFELLTKMHQHDINSFAAYRLSESPRPKRFPVFIRGEDDHKGSLSGIIHSQQDLERTAQRLVSRWHDSSRMIVVEYLDARGNDGIFRKYSAFKIGDRIVPRHVFFDTQWCVKSWHLLDQHLLDEELRYVDENPHAEALSNIFDLAGVDFGRVDYGIIDGKIQVWEINTNPILPVNFGDGGTARANVNSLFTARFIAAMKHINGVDVESEKITLNARAIPLWALPMVPTQLLYRRLRRGSRRKLPQAA